MKTFMKAEWRNLCMATYEVDPAILIPYVPRGTVLDTFEDKALVSLVGFEFLNTRIKNIPIPFHKKFLELNLRIYVRTGRSQTRGVTFIKEIVPKTLASFTARALYNEPFITRPMCHTETERGMAYGVYDGGEWRDLMVRTKRANALHNYSFPMGGTMEEFLLQRNLGLCINRKGGTDFYTIERNQSWLFMKGYAETRGIEKLYSPEFYPFLRHPPVHSMLVNGSEVKISHRTTIV
jgi:uncharacterized protein